MAGGHVREIDGLRALAVLSVMIAHLVPAWLPGGFIGVDIFFVISGYVVSRAMAHRPRSSLWFELADFFARRIRRIMPALLVCLLFTTLMTVLLVPFSWLSSTTNQTGLWAVFGLSNFALVLFQDGYFSPRTEFNPFMHTWSLAVEEQFYLVFPWLFLIWLRTRQIAGRSRYLTAGLWTGLALLSIVVAWAWSKAQPQWAYYLLPSRFWELAAGVMFYQLQASGRLGKLAMVPPNGFLLAGLIMVVTGLFYADPDAFPYPWALLPVLGTLLVLASVSRGCTASLARLGLGNGIAVYVGQMSYSLYLWHWPVYVMFRWTVGLEQGRYRLLAVLLTFLLAWFSWRLVERPVRSTRFLVAGSWHTLTAGALAISMAWLAVSSLFTHRESLSLSVTADTYQWYPYAFPAAPLPGPKPLAGHKIFVIGNSHGMAYSTMLAEANREFGIEIRQHPVDACPMGSLLKTIDSVPGCSETVSSLMQMLAQEAKPGDMVFFASLRAYRLIDQWAHFDLAAVRRLSRSEGEKVARLRSMQETEKLIQQLARLQVKVLIDAPKPVLRAPAFRCSDWFNRHNPVCSTGADTSRALLLEMRAPVMSSLQYLQQRNTNLTVWDPFPVLCPGEVCRAFDASGKTMFFDGDHLSAHGNRVLYPRFAQVLRNMYGISQTYVSACGVSQCSLDNTVL